MHMQRRIVGYALGTALLALALGGCSADAITNGLQDSALAAEQRADVAATAGTMTSEDLSEMYLTGSQATGMASVVGTPISGLHLSIQRAPLASWSSTGPCSTQDPATGRYVCGTATDGTGLSLDRSYAFLDANGQTQAQFDTATTTSINLQSHLYGTTSGTHRTATIARWRNVTVAKTPSWNTKRTWNGTGVDTTTAQYSDSLGTRSYDLKSSTVVKDVVVELPRSVYPYPLSGTATHTFDGSVNVQGSVTASKSLSYTAIVTFNGQRVVPVDVGTPHPFCLDLETGKLTDVSCQ